MSIKLAGISAVLFLAALSSAVAAEPINLGPAGKAAVEMTEVNGEYVLSVSLPNGKSQKISDEFVPFEMEGAPAAIAILDLDSDGVEEFVVRAMIPPQSGGLYIYKFSAKEKQFVAMVTGNEEGDTFLPVDAVAPVRVDRDGKVTARVIVRSEAGEKTEDRQFKLVKGKFKRVR